MAPMVNRLFIDIQENKELTKNIKMIAISIGNQPDEIAAYGQKLKVKFPMVPDPDKDISGKIKIEGTPTLFLINKNGKVLYSHAGFIEEEVLLTEIRKKVK
jgi:AhpC/TSA family.